MSLRFEILNNRGIMTEKVYDFDNITETLAPLFSKKNYLKKFHTKQRLKTSAEVLKIINENSDMVPINPNPEDRIQLITETLEVFDKWPINISKPKRMNLERSTTGSFSRSASVEEIHIHTPIQKEQASEVYEDHKMLLEDFNKIKEELELHKELDKKYYEAADALKIQAEEWAKLVTNKGVVPQPAFSEEQEVSLKKIEENLNKLLEIRNKKVDLPTSPENSFYEPRFMSYLNGVNTLLKRLNL